MKDKENIYLGKPKGGREIPVNGELTAVLKGIRQEEGLTLEYLFTYSE